MAPLSQGRADNLGPHNPVEVIAPVAEQHAAEALRRPKGGRRQRVLQRHRYRAGGVDHCRPGMGKHDVGVLVQRVHAAFEQVTGVQVVVRSPLEQLTPGLVDQEVVVPGAADVAGLAEVADPGVLLLVGPADIGGTVRRGVVGDDQFKILVALAEESVERPGQVFLTVVDREPNR